MTKSQKAQKLLEASRELIQAAKSNMTSQYIQDRAYALDALEGLPLLEVVFEAQAKIRKQREQEDLEFVQVVLEVEKLLGERALKQELNG